MELKILQLASRLARGALAVTRWCAYVLLRVCRPVLVPVMFWLSLGGIALWVVFVPIAGDTEFPTWRVLAMSLGCGLCAAMYYVALDWLRPTPPTT
jgi:hypothetical protein